MGKQSRPANPTRDRRGCGARGRLAPGPPRRERPAHRRAGCGRESRRPAGEGHYQEPPHRTASRRSARTRSPVSPRARVTVPDRGDVVWLDFNPQTGHEQAGRRPALVLSPVAYNRKVGLALVCPITSQVKGYPFEVQMPEGTEVAGVILADQVKSLDWRARRAKVVERVEPGVTAR